VIQVTASMAFFHCKGTHLTRGSCQRRQWPCAEGEKEGRREGQVPVPAQTLCEKGGGTVAVRADDQYEQLMLRFDNLLNSSFYGGKRGLKSGCDGAFFCVPIAWYPIIWLTSTTNTKNQQRKPEFRYADPAVGKTCECSTSKM
jgi:hypothetical protein